MVRLSIQRVALIALLMLASSAMATGAVVAAPAAIHPTAALQGLVSHIVFTPSSPNILPMGQNVTFTFNYSTSYPGGVRIWGRPFTHGALTPNYAAHGSPLYMPGSGSDSGFFTITTGNVTVDQVRFQIVAADTGVVLNQYFLPVSFQFSDSPILVSNIQLSPVTPNVLTFNQQVNLTFNYKSNVMGGIEVFPRPVTAGNLTPNYAASGSAVLLGSGSTNDDFTITSGGVTVDQIRFAITDATPQQNPLATFFLPVHYLFTGPSSAVTSITLSPPNPNILHSNEFVNMSFNYITTEAGGVRIFVLPYSHGAVNPNAADSPSPLYPVGSGSGTGFVSVFGANGLVDGILVEMTTDNQSAVLFSTILPVNYQFWQEIFFINLPTIFH